MKKISGFILTAPHACMKVHNEYCDSTTKEVVEMLSESSYPNLVDVYSASFESESPNIDMDTYGARNSQFRSSLTKKVLEFKQKYGNNVLLINIHSFNPSERPEWNDAEVVIVEGRTISDDLESVGLAYFLNKNGVMTKVVYNSYVDIHNEMVDLDVKNITLEFNQLLPDHRLNEIVKLINKWIHSPAGSMPTKGIRGGWHGHYGGHGGYSRGGYGYGGGGASFALGAGLLTGVALGSLASSPYGYGYGYGYPTYPAYPYPAYHTYPAYGYAAPAYYY